MIPTADRRRHRRVPLRVPVGIAAGPDGQLTQTTTVDVSLGGLCVLASDELEPGHEVTVVIGGGGRIIPAKAKVVRRISAADLLGLEFVRVAPGPRRTLRTWLGEGLSPRPAT